MLIVIRRRVSPWPSLAPETVFASPVAAGLEMILVLAFAVTTAIPGLRSAAAFPFNRSAGLKLVGPAIDMLFFGLPAMPPLGR